MVGEPQRYRTQYNSQQHPTDGLSEVRKGRVGVYMWGLVGGHPVAKQELQDENNGDII